jgi:hypothetical protein
VTPRRIATTCLLALLALAVSCGGTSGGWSEDSVDQFLAQCPYDSETCQCVVDRLQESVSFEEFREATEEGGPPPAYFTDAQAACLAT